MYWATLFCHKHIWSPWWTLSHFVINGFRSFSFASHSFGCVSSGNLHRALLFTSLRQGCQIFPCNRYMPKKEKYTK
jgi:hypothetical protein